MDIISAYGCEVAVIAVELSRIVDAIVVIVALGFFAAAAGYAIEAVRDERRMHRERWLRNYQRNIDDRTIEYMERQEFAVDPVDPPASTPNE